MKTVSGKHLARLAEARGWVFRRVKGSHHVYEKPGRTETLSIPLHGNKDLKIGLQSALMKLIGLKSSDL